MKFFRSKNILKSLIIIISIMTILAGIFPNYVQAKTDTDDGGGILKPIEDFILFLGDKVMGWLQTTFISTDDIEIRNGVYEFKYSPAIIFSGDVPAFDINFIAPNTDVKSEIKHDTYLKAKLDDYFKSATSITYSDYMDKIEEIEKNTEYKKVPGNGDNRNAPEQEGTYGYNIYYIDNGSTLTIKAYFIHIYDENKYDYLEYNTTETIDEEWAEENGVSKEYKSTAEVLQNTIATWYNALRKIALVGLLSVLVYVGIRIVLSSSSSEKAKYKEMLKDWLVAICLLFTLHYIMSITITVTNEISNIFQTGESDVLLNTLRAEISSNKDNLVILAKVIMYVVLVVLTVTFTIQYLKRVIYMAFYTLIAPLITLTYPLDKIKDGQAQAFNMWIKEYLYTALTQVIHLVIYFVLVGSALELVENNPIYAIVVLAFIKKAEGIIKKMFGFEKSETVGTLGQAIKGGLIMNAINSITSKVGGKSGGSSETKEDAASSSNIRTTSNNVLTSLGGDPGAVGVGSGSASGNGWNGAKAVAGKYGKKVIKGAGKGLIKASGSATGAMIGFASGVAQGDISAALTGAVAGGKAGSGLAQAGINIGKSIPGGVKNAANDLRDTWNTGAYGEEYAQNQKKVRDFKSTGAYKSLKKDFKEELTDDKIRIMLENGITDENNMRNVLNNWTGQN